jgi:hypothetical protein
MTLDEVKAVRDKFYNAILALDLNQLNHDIDMAEYRHDDHRDSLMKSFQFWDNLYTLKQLGGRTYRVNRKAV